MGHVRPLSKVRVYRLEDIKKSLFGGGLKVDKPTQGDGQIELT
jgi:hypothetical protein